MSKPLANNSYTVLGLLSFGDKLSGYDLRQWAKSLSYFYASPAQSQIYSELKRLEGLGYATSSKVSQEGKPDKRVYQITEAGKVEFTRWLTETPIEATTVKHSLALRLFFGHMASPEDLRAMLTSFIDKAKEQLGQLAIAQEYTENTEGFAYPALVANWSYGYLDNELKTAERVLEQLQEK